MAELKNNIKQTWDYDIDPDDWSYHRRYNRTMANPGWVTVNHQTENDEYRVGLLTVGGRIHAEPVCASGGDPETFQRVQSFYDPDGQRKVVFRGNEHDVVDCERCRVLTPLGDWNKRAHCKGSDLNAWDDADLFIELHCTACPVQRECLDQGEVDNVGGMVYGGTYLSKSQPQRTAAIKERRAQWNTTSRE